jgi:uncharacterized protein involved in exopolysaccharide biosynthesis/Mrp family chromosome partitioning ATPase
MSSIDVGTSSVAGLRYQPRNDVVSVLRRRLHIALPVFAVVFGAAVASLLILTPRYLATGTIIVAEPTTAIDAGQAAGADKIGDPADLESQIIVLKSPRIVRQALEKPDVLAAAIADCRNNAQGLLSAIAGSAKCGEPGQDPTLLVDQLQQRFSIGAVGRSRVISVNLDSTSPTVGQTLVNGLIDAFLADRADQFVRSKSDAGGTLQRDLDALDRDLRADEDKIREFRTKNHLIRGTIAPLSTEKLSALSQSLVQAEAAKAAAYARLQEIEKARQGDLSTNPTVANNPAFGNLKQQLVLIDLQIAHDAAHLGPLHPTMVSLGEMREALMRRIRLEMDGIAATTKASYDASAALVAQLRSKIGSTATEADSELDDESSIGDLVRSVEARKTRYAELSRQLTEVTSRKPPFADSTRLVSKAEVPSAPYFPKRLPFLAGGFVLALMLAGFAAIATDRLDTRLRTSAALTSRSGLPLLAYMPFVAPPVVSSWLRRKLGAKGTVLRQSLRVCWDDPTYRASLDQLAAQVLAAKPDDHALKLAIVSPGASEGRTHTLVALGQTLASLGKRVLIIEGDMRQPSIARALSLPEVPGLSDILQRQSPFEGQVHQFGESELFVLAAGTASTIGAPAFMGPHMADVIRFADTFDIVLIDTPPFEASKDAEALARLAGHVLVCARWEAGNTSALQAMLDQIAATGARPLGIVATQVDAERQSLYERRPRPEKKRKLRRPLLKAAT